MIFNIIRYTIMPQRKEKSYKKVFRMLGASNHVKADRALDDYYATSPEAAKHLLELENFDGLPIWECASGEDHLAQVFKKAGFMVRTSDICKRTKTTEVLDFLKTSEKFSGHIITNPPYSLAKEFILKALSCCCEGNKVCMFLKLQFLEGKNRKELFEKFPPKTIWVSRSRIMCAKNGDFEGLNKSGGSAVAYAWFIWEKGYKGSTVVKWFN